MARNNTPETLSGKTILLIVSGGIAAYKSLDLIRKLRKDGAEVRCILTKSGEQFVTPLSIAALSEHTVYTDLWSLKDETEMGHIRLSREADLIVIAPASANLIAQMAHGLAQDLASTTLLAADKPVLIAPAMNHKMWYHPATQTNIQTLQSRGVLLCGPEEGDMACGEFGLGRMAEPDTILHHIKQFFFNRAHVPLRGLRALVTAGPTFEALDPVRFIGNRSSGKQGYAIAEALARAGADVTLISGPVALPAPPGVHRRMVETARDMLSACEATLPADIAVCAAAVSDWTARETQPHKIKKRGDRTPPVLDLMENPDILKTICGHPERPRLVVGFAAETENMLQNAREKRAAKGCDWIVANDVSVHIDGSQKAFGADQNHVYLITQDTTEEWPRADKSIIAARLADKITQWIKGHDKPRHTQNAAE